MRGDLPLQALLLRRSKIGLIFSTISVADFWSSSRLKQGRSRPDTFYSDKRLLIDFTMSSGPSVL
jgi:hypothetical protein